MKVIKALRNVVPIVFKLNKFVIESLILYCCTYRLFLSIQTIVFNCTCFKSVHSYECLVYIDILVYVTLASDMVVESSFLLLSVYFPCIRHVVETLLILTVCFACIRHGCVNSIHIKCMFRLY